MVSSVAVTAKFHTPRRTIPHSHSAKVATHRGQESRTPTRRFRGAAAGVPGPGRPAPAPCTPPPSINAPHPRAGRGGRGLGPIRITTAARPEDPQQPPAPPPTKLKLPAPWPRAPRSQRARPSGVRARPVRGAAPGRASGPSRSPLGVRRLPPPLPPPPPCECSGV